MSFRLRPGRVHLAVLAAYCVLTVVMTWPLALNLTTAIPGDSFDGWQNYWNQWWIKVALVDRQQSPLVTDLLFYPTGVGLYFHTLNPFNGVTTLPIQLALGLLPAYNAVVFLSWVLGGYGAYLLALWVLKPYARPVGASRRLAAFLAGVIFTFSPFHMAHLLGHMQVMAFQWVPFYILYLLRALARQKRGEGWLWDAGMAGLFLTLAALCDWYFVLYLFLFSGLILIFEGIVALASGYWPWGKQLSALGARLLPALSAGAVFLMLTAPLLLPMIREATQFSYMVRPVADLYLYSASVMDFLVPNRMHTLFRPESFAWIGNQVAPPSEKTVSIGYLPLALALLAGWYDRRRSGLWLASALFFMLLALGPRLHLGDITPADLPLENIVAERWTPYAVLNRLVPFMHISRSVSRYALMVQLCVAVAAAGGMASLLARLRHPAQAVGVITLALVVVLAEFWVAPFPLSPPDTPPFYGRLPNRANAGAVLNLPMNYDRPGYLLYQTVHHRPLTVGYISRDDPRTLTARVPVLQHFRHLGPDILADDPVRVGLSVLHDLGVDLVVLDRYKMPGGLEREYTEQLAGAIFAGASPFYEDERLTVYEVQPPSQPLPYLLLGALNWGARQTDANGAPYRQIGDRPAAVHVVHEKIGAALRLRYRTEAAVSIYVETDGQRALILPPAPDGNSQQVTLSGAQSITLTATAPAGAAIEMIELVAP